MHYGCTTVGCTTVGWLVGSIFVYLLGAALRLASALCPQVGKEVRRIRLEIVATAAATTSSSRLAFATGRA